MGEAMEFAIAVAKELGDGWSAGPDTYGAQLNGPDGVTLFVRIGANTWHAERGRVRISWWCQEELRKYRTYDDKENHSITVADTRPPRQVAGEIKRRLLPLVTQSLTNARTRKADSDAYQAEQDRFLAQIKRALGELGRKHDTHNNVLTVGSYLDDCPLRGEIKVGSGDEMLVELRIKRDLLPSLAVTLAALAGGK